MIVEFGRFGMRPCENVLICYFSVLLLGDGGMKRFVEGEDRRQGALLPHCLDDYVTENNPVRVIEAFIDELDLATLGLRRCRPRDHWAPSVPSSDATEDLSLRLSQPRAVEPAARTGSAAQYRADVADRAAGTRLQDDRRLPQGQWRGDPGGVRPACGVVPPAGAVHPRRCCDRRQQVQSGEQSR